MRLTTAAPSVLQVSEFNPKAKKVETLPPFYEVKPLKGSLTSGKAQVADPHLLSACSGGRSSQRPPGRGSGDPLRPPGQSGEVSAAAGEAGGAAEEGQPAGEALHCCLSPESVRVRLTLSVKCPDGKAEEDGVDAEKTEKKSKLKRRGEVEIPTILGKAPPPSVSC